MPVRRIALAAAAALCTLAGLATAAPAGAAQTAGRSVPRSTATASRAGTAYGCARPVRSSRVGGAVAPRGLSASPRCGEAQRRSGVSARDVLLPGASYLPYENGGSPPLRFNGGAVMGTSSTPGAVTVTPIFWSPSGYSFASGYEGIIEQYLNDVASASGTFTNVFSVLGQYDDASGRPIRYAMTAGAPLLDSDAYPTSGCSVTSGSIYANGSSSTSCLTDGQINTEVTQVVSADHLPDDLAHLYLMFLPEGVEACYLDGGGNENCSLNSSTSPYQFCGYHSSSATSTGAPLYAVLPYSDSPNRYGATCLSGESPNGDPAADSIISVTSHETSEAITDPLGSAWFDSAGYEVADECDFVFGNSAGPADSKANQTINGHAYYLQEEFSNTSYAANSANGCLQSNSSSTATFTESASAVPLGSAVSFDGSGSFGPGTLSYTWNFGDGTTATGVTAGHTYTAAGTYTVTLTVSAGGSLASTSRTVGVTVAPSPPTGLSASGGSGAIALSWSAPANAIAPTTYSIYRGQGAVPNQLIGTTTTTSYTDSAVTGGLSYDYAVVASDAGGTSSPSATAAGMASTPPSNAAPALSSSPATSPAPGNGAATEPGAGTVPRVPGVPTDVSAIAGNGLATVSFRPAPGGSSATAVRFTVTAYPSGARVLGTSSPIVVHGLTNGERYSFNVTASSSTGTSAVSTRSQAVTPESGVVVLARASGTVEGATVSFTTRCARAACHGRAELVARTSGHGGGHLRVADVVLAVARIASGAGGRHELALRLTATGRKDLAHARSRAVAAVLEIAIAGGGVEDLSVVLS
jgi:PKD repeat protein